MIICLCNSEKGKKKKKRRLRVQRSRGQSEQTGLLVVNDVLLNVESKFECEPFPGHFVHYSLAVVVPQRSAHLLIRHLRLVLVCSPQPHDGVRIDDVEFVVVARPLDDAAVVGCEK